MSDLKRTESCPAQLMEEKTRPDLTDLSVAPEFETQQEKSIDRALKDFSEKNTESHEHEEYHEEVLESPPNDVSASPKYNVDNDIKNDNDKNFDYDNDVTLEDTHKTVFKPVPAPRTKLNVVGKS